MYERIDKDLPSVLTNGPLSAIGDCPDSDPGAVVQETLDLSYYRIY
jgi:hypothetical protein